MIIDLRSDTVTVPTAEMKEAMFNAKVGDDVFREDDTVNQLEELGANMFGKEAGIFCPSGVMTNQIAIKIHTNPPGEVICDETSHIYQYEGGGIGFNSGLATKLIKGNRGRVTADIIASAINPDDVHKPVTQLVSIENTSNRGGGSIYELDEIKRIKSLCNEESLKLHLDGARIFNAIVESDYTAKDIGNQFDTISICLSKGLGAPVGSLLVGSAEDIKQARRIRKIFGGGMRQAGYLAAAGIYALENNVKRLGDDHRRAKEIGSAAEKLPFVDSVMPIDTNIVVLNINVDFDYIKIIQQLGEQGLKTIAFGPNQIRLVTHLNFTDDMLSETLSILKTIK